MRHMATNFTKELIVKPGKKVKSGKFDPDETLGWEKKRWPGATRLPSAAPLASAGQLE